MTPKQATSSAQVLFKPFSARTIWTIRLVLLGLVGLWLTTVVYLHYQIKADRARIEQKRIEESRRRESARRGVVYQQQLQEYRQDTQTRNLFDAQ